MSIIQLKEANCKNCYKCIRHCPVKSITFHDDQARILEDECVLCGTCTLVCPQNAKQIQSDLQKVHAMIDQGEKVYASVAPSFVAAFPRSTFASLSARLKKLGFAGVEETAIGATRVSEAYCDILEKQEVANLITTCCPTVVLLIEKYFPDLLPQLAKVPSPAVAHAKLLRAAYGEDIKVCFIGPCISKKQEALSSGQMDAVLMFNEVRDWFRREGIHLDEVQDDHAHEMHATLSRVYPVPGGILKTIPPEKRVHYKAVAVDGMDRCLQMLKDIREHHMTGYVLEMSACVDSCVGGPGLHDITHPFLLVKDQVYSFSQQKTEGEMPLTEQVQVDMRAAYTDQSGVHKRPNPSSEEIWKILHSIGKYTQDDLLNCGACGYDTCWDKALAVYEGKANLKMCLPYMRQRAESMSNTILDNTPNGLLLLDENFGIMKFNRAAAEMLNLDNSCLGMDVSTFLVMDELNKIRQDGQNVMNVRCKTAIYDVMVEQSIVHVPDKEYLVLLKDITAEEDKIQEMKKMRQETIDTAQQVIDKQMRVAQEIASLLGETTGETKAALLKLKDSMNRGGQR